MRDPDKPKSFSGRLALIEETIPGVLVELMALSLLLKLLFEQEAERADDEGVMPLDVLVFDKVDEIFESIDPETTDTGEWLRARAARTALDLLGLSGEMVDVEDLAEEPPTNDNGPG